MPHLPDSYYFQHYVALRDEWLRGAFAFTVLTPTEQIAVHNYYEPSLELSDAQLRAHRKRVTLEQPSLPHRAGRAYARIAPFLDGTGVPTPAATSVVVAGRRKGELRRISVYGEVQPHIDPARIAQILLDAAMEQLRRERAEREQDDAA
jgi:hypothetical protein